ncbi:hypothetical protein FMUND_13323 [Fusarium mundagurra]|uniref:Uncharacterized protein n=1 Tax=Fusarium mundagurra TaxID=1567541 RepID=A0A8H5XZ66_9HYPO|nr:hypothetical protein FMUND_13323 [Fusarium mundagurra]
MSIAAAIATALEHMNLTKRRASIASPAQSSRASIGPSLPHRDGRLVCVVDDMSSRCTFCKRDHKKCTAIPPELKPVIQAYWNALHSEFSTDRPLTRLEKWRAAPEIHDNATIEENIRRTDPAYARECREANAFVAVLERLPTAFETPVDGEDRHKKARLPPMELPDEFTEDMGRLIAKGNLATRNVARTVGHGPFRRGSAQATPQKRRRALKEDDDKLEEGSGGLLKLLRNLMLDLVVASAIAARLANSLVVVPLVGQYNPAARKTRPKLRIQVLEISENPNFGALLQGISWNLVHRSLLYSQTRGDGPVAIVKANDRGGVLVITEFERNNDQSIAGNEARIGMVTDLHDATKVRGIHAPLEHKYSIVHKQYRLSVKPLNPEPETYLRRENVATNDLSYCKVYSIPQGNENHYALVKRIAPVISFSSLLNKHLRALSSPLR